MKAIIGLGNPGKRYRDTRHNLGFMVIDSFAEELQDSWQEKFDCNFMRFELEGQPYLLIKPLKYMNLSGETVRPLLQYFKISAKDVIVVHDELDLLPGVVKVKIGGSAGGHGGIKDIIQCLGTEDFIRIRLGIGHPRDCEEFKADVSTWVLASPSKDEETLLKTAVNTAIEAIKETLKNGLVSAQRKFNRN